VAAQVFTERGYDATGMEHLAKAAGITKSSFYHHVSGKEELLRRSLDRALGHPVCGVGGRRFRPAVVRLEQVLRGSVRCGGGTAARDVALRVRGTPTWKRAAVARRREFGSSVAELVLRPRRPGPGADIEPDLRALAVRHGELADTSGNTPGGGWTPTRW